MGIEHGCDDGREAKERDSGAWLAPRLREGWLLLLLPPRCRLLLLWPRHLCTPPRTVLAMSTNLERSASLAAASCRLGCAVQGRWSCRVTEPVLTPIHKRVPTSTYKHASLLPNDAVFMEPKGRAHCDQQAGVSSSLWLEQNARV